MAPPPIQLQFFGTFALSVDGSVADGVPKPVQELLAHLAIAGQNGVDRAEAATNIWPDVEGERGLFYLRRALSQLRTVLGLQRDRLQAAGDRRIALDLEKCSCDLMDLEAASRRPTQKNLTAAVEAYSGKLLVSHRSEWVRNHRARYHELYCRFLCELAALAEQDGNLEVARDWLIRASRADSIREDTAWKLMRLLAKSGDFAGIVRAFRDLRHSLRREVGLPPSQAIIDLYRELLAGARLVASDRTEEEEPVSEKLELPAPPTPFFERSPEQAELKRAVKERRLVTLTGPGGVGKSRLAIETAQDFSAEGMFRVTYADISACLTHAEVEDRMTRALRLIEASSPTDKTLLVVDGTEQVATECSKVIAELLKGAPELHILCTSRVALRLREEHVIVLAPLRLPEGGLESTAFASEAVEFFLECAKRVAPASQINGQSMGAIAELCRRLDGLPLALELAAVRLRTLPVQEIIDNLENQFGVLESASDSQDRKTLKNVLDWSRRLLSEDEVSLFTRLSVFPSNWTLAAAKSVCAFSGLAPNQIPALLGNLVDHSLVLFDASTGRYRMLETVRSYAKFESESNAGFQTELLNRHADYYLNLATESASELSGHDEANFNLAVETFLTGGSRSRRENALRLVNRLFTLWYRIGGVADGLRTALRALESFPKASNEVVAETLFRAAGAAHWLYRLDLARELYEKAERIADKLGLEAWGTESIRSRGELAANSGRLKEAQELLSTALQRIRTADDPLGEAACLGMLGYVARMELNDPQAFELTEAALSIYTKLDNSEGRLWCLGSLAAAHLSSGSTERAIPLLLETLSLQEKAENVPAQAWNLTMLGVAHVRLGEFERAERFLLQALEVQELEPEDLRRGWALLELGELYRLSGRLSEAVEQLNSARRLCHDGGAVSMEVQALLRLCLAALDSGDTSSAKAFYGAATGLLETIEKPPQMDELEEIAARMQGNHVRA